MDDIAPVPGELSGAFVLAKKGNCRFTSLDPSSALVSKTVKHCNFSFLVLALFFHSCFLVSSTLLRSLTYLAQTRPAETWGPIRSPYSAMDSSLTLASR